jgi:hypothetical protein
MPAVSCDRDVSIVSANATGMSGRSSATVRRTASSSDRAGTDVRSAKVAMLTSVGWSWIRTGA